MQSTDNSPSNPNLDLAEFNFADFAAALRQLPRDVLVAASFSIALSNLSTVCEIASKLGVELITSIEETDLKSGVEYISIVGKMSRNESVDAVERDAARQVYSRLPAIINKIAAALEIHRAVFTDDALNAFDSCSIEGGCSGPAAVEIIKNPSNFNQFSVVADAFAQICD